MRTMPKENHQLDSPGLPKVIHWEALMLPWKPFFLVSLGILSGLKCPKLWKRHVWVGMSGSCLSMRMCWRGQYI